MALIECSDCGSKVSDAAPACPQCGRPAPAVNQSAARKTQPSDKSLNQARGVLVLILIGLGIWIYNRVSTVSDSNEANFGSANATKKTEAASAPAEKKCDPSADAQCVFDADDGSIIVNCKNAIQQKSPHTVKWDDGFSDGPVFMSVQWNDKTNTQLFLLGDVAEFQNDFGAMTPVHYSCLYDVASKTVADVTVGVGKFNP